MFKQTVATLALFAALTTTAFAQSRIDDPPAPVGGIADLQPVSWAFDLASMKLRVRISNQGSAEAKSCQALVMFRTYEGKTLGCVLVSSCLLASGQDTEVSAPISTAALIAHMADKGMRVSIKADANNQTTESNEVNNTVSFNW